jgi:hypothetical protein
MPLAFAAAQRLNPLRFLGQVDQIKVQRERRRHGPRGIRR